MVTVAMGGQITRNPKSEPEKSEPEPEITKPEKPELKFGFQTTVPEINTGNSGIRPRYPKYPNYPKYNSAQLF